MDAQEEEGRGVEIEAEILEEEEDGGGGGGGAGNESNNGRKTGFKHRVLRLSLAILFPILAFLLLSLIVGFLAVFFSAVARFFISSTVSVPSRCRIVSSSVDLRSSKVCELGSVNYEAKNAFHPFDSSKFRCRYDYYWVSIFEVEYKDYYRSKMRMALSETPTEALPLTCRPSFGFAWLTKDKFKVNETYDCWYMSGISKVSLYPDGFFSCQAKGPSSIEIIRQYFFQLTEFLHSLFIHTNGKASYWRWETVAGVISGFSTSVISISFIKILQLVNSWLAQTCAAKMVARAINMVFLKRACFLVAYFSFMGWLMIQFGTRIGLPEIYRVYNY